MLYICEFLRTNTMTPFKLRAWQLSDIDSLAKHANNSNIAKWLTDQFPYPYDKQAAEGVTIHSFFQISFAPFVPETTFNSAQIQYRYSQEKRNIIRSMDLLVIDEISMVRMDLLDAVDATLIPNLVVPDFLVATSIAVKLDIPIRRKIS